MSYILLSIDEVEGDMTSFGDSKVREKVFCVLGDHQYQNYTPVHTQSINPRPLPKLTLKLRVYNRVDRTFEDYDSYRVGLWFKLTTEDC